ncbi:MAG: exodeoxyribonuclease VII large subunit [Ardenticatenaceae bacterium]|nr:exodeoxyribonuclease VII large subunit [Ardenticatenaceae bacterium]
MGFLRNAGSSSGYSEVWTVGELNSYIKDLFEIDYRLQDVEVSGEISNFSLARSGHLYFTLKDEKAQLRCVMWRSAAERLRFAPKDGDAVVAGGRVSVYEASGVYQLYAERLEPAGRGNLALAFERLKEQLADEGLFDPAHKKPIPAFPSKIGIVTSADAAALRDILNVLRRRYPLVQVLIAPTLVQGEQAPAQIVRALQWLDGRSDLDTLIIARGGGSIEDLWAFNDERVARAVFAAHHPIISGVGHETDFTITDFVADLRAPTPSAAAELAVPDREELYPLVLGLQNGLTADIKSRIQEARWEVQSLGQQLALHNPRRSLDSSRQRVDMLVNRLDQSMERRLTTARNRLALLEAQLTAVNPQTILARGYAIVRDPNGRLLRTAANATVGQHLHVQLSDGVIEVEVISNR